jgi:hypothetical protein
MSVHSKIESLIDGQKSRVMAAFLAVALMPAVASAETVSNYGGCQQGEGQPLAASVSPGETGLMPGQVNAAGEFSHNSDAAKIALGAIACPTNPNR